MALLRLFATSTCALRSGTSSAHRLTACGHWGCECYNASQRCGARWTSCGTLPLFLGAADSEPRTMHCHFTMGSLKENSCNTLPHRLWAVGTAHGASHCLVAVGPWVAHNLQHTAAQHGDNGRWNSCGTLPHCLGTVAMEFMPHNGARPRGGCQGNLLNTLLHCHGILGNGTPALWFHTPFGAGGSGTPAIHRHNALGHWAVGLGHHNLCGSLPHCLGAVGGESCAIHWRFACGEGAIPQHSATLCLGCGQRSHGITPLLCRGVMSSGTHARHGYIAYGQRWWNSCRTFAHYLREVGIRILALHRHSARGQWVVEPLNIHRRTTSWQRSGTPPKPRHSARGY